MQLRMILVPLLAALPSSCKSAQENSTATNTRTVGKAAPAETTNAAQDPVEAQKPAGESAAAIPASAPMTAQDPGSDVDRYIRQTQQGKFLSAASMAEGDRLLETADLPGALKAYSAALELDPTSTLAREKLRRVEALMGDKYTGAASFLQDATEQEMVRRAQARMAAEDARTRAKNALATGDYATAIEQYRQAEMILRYNPLIATDALDQKIVAGELETALKMADEARNSKEQQAIEMARQARERREKDERDYRESKLRTLYGQANTAFLAEDFQRSEQLCQQILLEDPNNKAATDLLKIARDMRHQKTDEDNRRHYREQWIRTMEEVDTMDVIQTGAIAFNDMKRWREVTDRKPLEFETLQATDDSGKQAVMAKLEQTRVEARFMGPDGNGSSLEDIANYLQGSTGINFIISPKVKAELDEEQRTVRLDLGQRSVRSLLDLILELKTELRWKIEDGVVKIVTKAEAKGGQILRMYEVRDLIHAISDFPGREMNVAPSGGVNLPEEDRPEREANVITDTALDQLIRENVAKESWEQDTGNSIRVNGGTMVVSQTPEVHAQILRLLDDLREATGIMVDIQARFLKVEDNFLEDIGVDFRGLGQPGLGTNAFFNDFGDSSTQQDLGSEIGQNTDLGAFYDRGGREKLQARVEQLYDTSLGDANVLQGTGGASFQWTYLNDLQLELILRAVSKSERVELVTSPRITVYNAARGNLSVLNQVAYVQDFNVEIAQAASIADPIVNVVQDGVILDVRPVVSADRRFITLELRPTIATLKRPIREVVTTLGSQNSVTIQLPEVELQKVRTSIPMPDGGTVMLGGLKVSDKQDNKSGVPILNKIPVVSFFFERKGQYVSNRKLLILLKAQIVIPQEHEPTPAQVGPTTRPASKP